MTPTGESVTRRQFLAGAGALGGSVLAGCAGTDQGQSQRQTASSGQQASGGGGVALDPANYADRFENVVNVVKAGADNAGKEPVADVVADAWADDTLLVFPPGRYVFERQIRRTGSRNVGVLGQGAVLAHASVDAIDRHQVTAGGFVGQARFFQVGVDYAPHDGDFLFGGFIVDQRGENEGMQLLNHHTDGQSEIRNIAFRGIHSLGCQGAFRVNPMAPDATAHVANVDMRAGGKHYANTINSRSGRDGESWATSGLTTHPEKSGHLRVENVLCGGWPDNGLYVKGGDGREEVVNCTAANSRVSNIRVGGSPSFVSNCTVVIDRGLSEEIDGGQVGIRLDKGAPTLQNSRVVVRKELATWAVQSRRVDEATIRNCEFHVEPPGTTGIFCSPLTGPTRIEDVRFRTPGWDGADEVVLDPSENATLDGVTDDGTPI